MTVVDGVITFIDGVHTGALPGKLVRNPLTFAADQRTNLADVYAPLHRFKPTPFRPLRYRLPSHDANSLCLARHEMRQA